MKGGCQSTCFIIIGATLAWQVIEKAFRIENSSIDDECIEPQDKFPVC